MSGRLNGTHRSGGAGFFVPVLFVAALYIVLSPISTKASCINALREGHFDESPLGEEYLITPAELKDAEAIQAINAVLHLDIPHFRWDQLEFISEEINKGHYYVLKRDHAIVAAISLFDLNDAIVIDTIAVAKTHQQRGLGRKLIEFAEAMAKQKYKSEVRVSSFIEYNNRGFYEQCGFKALPKTQIFHGYLYYDFVKSI